MTIFAMFLGAMMYKMADMPAKGNGPEIGVIVIGIFALVILELQLWCKVCGK